MVLPVIKALEGSGRFDVSVLALTTARAFLDLHGITALGFRDFVTASDELALVWGRELMEQSVHPDVDPAESVAYLGLSFAELVMDLGIDRARDTYASLGRAAFLPVRVLGRVLDQVCPDVVVTTNSPRAEMAAILAARARSVPAVCLVDLFAHEEIRYISQPGYANRVCVLDEHVRSRFLAAGRSDHDVVVTGNPAFDTLADPELAAAADRWLVQQPWKNAYKILWISQPEPAHHRVTGVAGDVTLPKRILRALHDVVDKHPDWHLVVRPHPSEDPSGFHARSGCSLSSSDQSLHMLLHAVDVVVCMTSTVGYEAAIAGKPLVHLPWSVYCNEADYSAMGLAMRCNELNDLELVLEAIRSRTWNPKLQLNNLGCSTASVCAVVESLLQDVSDNEANLTTLWKG